MPLYLDHLFCLDKTLLYVLYPPQVDVKLQIILTLLVYCLFLLKL